MTDPAQAMEVVKKLGGAGIKVSIDDSVPAIRP